MQRIPTPNAGNGPEDQMNGTNAGNHHYKFPKFDQNEELGIHSTYTNRAPVEDPALVLLRVDR